jgi:hypothetical protein
MLGYKKSAEITRHVVSIADTRLLGWVLYYVENQIGIVIWHGI